MNPVTFLIIGSICTIVAESKEEPWDFFLFVEQWPQSLCVKEREDGRVCVIPRKNTDWTIHGLWPSKDQLPTPYHCNNQTFDMNEIKELLPKMNEFWTDFRSKKSLWEHEWYSHGTCAISLNATSTQKLYFQKGLSLRMIYELKPILEKCRVVPSNSKTYSGTYVLSCLEKGLVNKPLLYCYNTKDDEVILSEIRLCMSKKFQLQDCHEYTNAIPTRKDDYHLHPCGERNFTYPIIKYQ